MYAGEIPAGERRPVGEQQCQRGTGDAEIVQEIPYGVILLEQVETDEQNVDTAQVERQIADPEFSHDAVENILGNLQ